MSESSSSLEEDPSREARAWNASIYLMVSMPYLLLGGLGLLIYREVRKKSQADPSSAGVRGASGAENLSCSRETLAETSCKPPSEPAL